jgi:hypothetical protein
VNDTGQKEDRAETRRRLGCRDRDRNVDPLDRRSVTFGNRVASQAQAFEMNLDGSVGTLKSLLNRGPLGKASAWRARLPRS